MASTTDSGKWWERPPVVGLIALAGIGIADWAGMLSPIQTVYALLSVAVVFIVVALGIRTKRFAAPDEPEL